MTDGLDVVNVLIVDDDEDDYLITSSLLSEVAGVRYEVSWASSSERAREAISSHTYDVCLLDYYLGAKSGLDVARDVLGGTGMPVILLTGVADHTIDLQAMEAGVSDFLVKGSIGSTVLERSIRYAIQRHRLLNELEESRTQQLRLKDDLLSHVSHELRTPLASIHSYAGILLDGIAGPISPAQQEYLEVVMNNVGQLVSMVDDLLDASKAEAGVLAFHPRPLDVAPLVKQITETMSPAAQRAEVELIVDQAGPTEILADPVRTTQVLLNLVDNAIKVSPAGASVTIQVKSAAEGRVQFAVTDEGPGIDVSNQALVFERLHQLDNGQSRSRKGLGLGLYIAREAVTRQGGRIWVDSELGSGSSFRFELPSSSLSALLERLIATTNETSKPIHLIKIEIPHPTVGESGRAQDLGSQVHAALRNAIFPSDIVLPDLGGGAIKGVHYVAGAIDPSDLAAVSVRIADTLTSARLVDVGEPAVSAELVQLPAQGSTRELAEQLADQVTAIILGEHEREDAAP